VTYSFNEKDGWTAKEEPKVKVPVEIHEKLMCLYPSDKEKSIYNVLANKDRIKNQFYIYLTFEWMEAAYKELLYNEKKYEKELKKVEYNNIPDRKEFIYKVGYDYIILDKDYTMGGYKFSELQPAIQKDILKIFQNINYMRLNGKVKAQSEVDKFLDYQGKVLKYELFRIGR